MSNNNVRCVDIKNDATIRQTGSTYYVVEAITLRDFGWFTLILSRDQRKFSKQCVYLKKKYQKNIIINFRQNKLFCQGPVRIIDIATVC